MPDQSLYGRVHRLMWGHVTRPNPPYRHRQDRLRLGGFSGRGFSRQAFDRDHRYIASHEFALEVRLRSSGPHSCWEYSGVSCSQARTTVRYVEEQERCVECTPLGMDAAVRLYRASAYDTASHSVCQPVSDRTGALPLTSPMTTPLAPAQPLGDPK